MPGNGPPPAERRRRNNKDPNPTTAVAAPKVESPDPPAGDWAPETLAWYATWRSAPQASTFLVTDWQRLTMLFRIVEAYFRTGDPRYMTEIRLNESMLGATHVDRLKARIKVEDVAPPKLASVTSVDRRNRLAG